MRPFLLCLPALALVHPAAAAERVVAYEIVDARAIPDSLTGRSGDPEAGRKLFHDTDLARCAGCHGSPEQPDSEPRGGAVPTLAGVGGRLDAGEIRLWLVAPLVISPDTAMPSYYTVGQRDDPADPRFGEPLLTASEIEDLVAYLMRQTDGR